jgi:hypothetical protein
MSPAQDQNDNEEVIEEEQPAPKPPREPVRKIYIVALLLVVLGVGGFALSGPACNMKEPGRDLKDLTQQEIIEQAINRFKDMGATVKFSDTTHVMAKPVPVKSASPGLVVNSVLAVKSLGQSDALVTHHTGQNYVAYKLRLPDGACGYVFSTDGIQIGRQ